MFTQYYFKKYVLKFNKFFLAYIIILMVQNYFQVCII